jgi:hypothetical protein
VRTRTELDDKDVGKDKEKKTSDIEMRTVMKARGKSDAMAQARYANSSRFWRSGAGRF